MPVRRRVLTALIVSATVIATVFTPTAAGAADVRPSRAPGSITIGKPATASSERPRHPAKLAVDADVTTRWESTRRVDPQWISIDLTAVYLVNSIYVTWAPDCAKTYRYELSRDGTTWTTVFQRTNFAGGIDRILLGPSRPGRYLRIFATERCHRDGGYAIKEIDAFGRLADTVPPTAPGSLRASGVNGTSVSLTWTPAFDNEPFLTYDVHANGKAVTSVSGNTLATMATGLAPATDYTLTVVARDLSGNVSPPSNPVSVRTLPTSDVPSPPTAPRNVRPVAISTTCVTVTWDASTGANPVARYDVYVSGLVGPSVTTPTAETCGLTPHTTYGFTVVAWDTKENVSAPSPSRSVTTLDG
jgi:chitodextrinase